MDEYNTAVKKAKERQRLDNEMAKLRIDKRWTLQRIGTKYNMSRERVRQRIKRALGHNTGRIYLKGKMK